jgi:hypothetical protein
MANAMKKLTTAGLVVVALLLVGGGVVWRWPRDSGPAAVIVEKEMKHDLPAPRAAQPPGGPRASVPGRSATEKAARIERIKRDYDEVRAKTAADYSAAGAAFPGGLNAFLRQLALLERELHNDLAAVLTPRELEDLELRDTTAGQLVQALLGDTAASEEQRRAVFRLQRRFDNEFALTFDLAPATLLTRERARQRTQEEICAVLDPPLRAAWLKCEGGDYGNFAAFVAQQNLTADTALALWRVKNDYTLRQLEINTRPGYSVEQVRVEQAAVAQQARAQVLGLVGPAAFQAAGSEVLGWLPRGK